MKQEINHSDMVDNVVYVQKLNYFTHTNTIIGYYSEELIKTIYRISA